MIDADDMDKPYVSYPPICHYNYILRGCDHGIKHYYSGQLMSNLIKTHSECVIYLKSTL